MKKTYIFCKNKDNQVYQIISQMSTWLSNVLCSLTYGKYIIKIEKYVEPRSIDQNNLMWMWFTAVAKEWTELTGTHYDKDEIYEIYTAKFLTKAIRTPAQELIKCVGRTSALNKVDMTEFLNLVQADCLTEWGIALPQPEDRWFDEWRNNYNL